MKERAKNLYQIILFCLLSATILGCGGSSSNKTVNYTISADTVNIAFSNEFLQVSQDSFQVDITFNGKGLLVGYAPDSQAVAWLNYRTENVTATSATLHVDVVNAENFLANAYNTKLRLSTGDVDNINLTHHDIDISLLVWQLAVNTELVSFRGTLGDTSIAEQSISITSEANQWTATSDVDWLTLDTAEGTGNGTIVLTPNVSSLTSSQLYQGNVTLTEVTSGDTKIIPVEFGMDDIRLAASHPALAFNSLATQSKLAHSIDIFNNGINAVTWQASTNVNWLSLAQDNVNNKLTVTADPLLLAENGLHNAEITLSSTTNGEALPGTILVSLHKGDTDSSEVILNDITINDSGAVLDPLRPYFYIAHSDKISIYSVIDGSVVKIISSPMVDLDLTNLVIHPNGSMLLASNLETYTENNEEKTRVNHFKVSLSDHSISQLDNEKITIINRPAAIVMISGKPVVITQARELADMSLTRHYVDNQSPFLSATVNDVKNNNLVHIFYGSTSSINQYQLSYNAYASQTAVIESSISYDNVTYGNSMGNLVSDNKGTTLYTANLNSEWSTFDGELFADQGLLHNDTILATIKTATDSNNNSYFYRYNSALGFTFSKYDMNQALQWEAVHTNGSNEIYIAPDFQRLISYNRDTSVLAFDATP